jgi:hypothetical protein
MGKWRANPIVMMDGTSLRLLILWFKQLQIHSHHDIPSCSLLSFLYYSADSNYDKYKGHMRQN